MVIFHSYVKLPQGRLITLTCEGRSSCPWNTIWLDGMNIQKQFGCQVLTHVGETATVENSNFDVDDFWILMLNAWVMIDRFECLLNNLEHKTWFVFFWSWHGCLVGSISVVVLYFIPKLNEGELTWNHSKMKASYIIYNIYITCFPLNGSNEDRLKSYSQLCCLNHPFRPYFFRLSGDDIGQQSQLYEINLCKSIK
jgi:hypothetical protein